MGLTSVLQHSCCDYCQHIVDNGKRCVHGGDDNSEDFLFSCYY
jgi:hypothetical protein